MISQLSQSISLSPFAAVFFLVFPLLYSSFVFITFLYPHSFFALQSPRLSCASHSFHSILYLPSLPLPLLPHLLFTNETLHYASIYHRPNGLSTRSFIPRSQPRPGRLHSSFTRCQSSCPNKSVHCWACAPHAGTSGPYHRSW